MVLRYCDFGGCCHPAESSFGSCMLCAKHWCFQHLGPDYHSCPSVDDDAEAYYASYAASKTKYLASLLAKIRVEALKSAASRARGGKPCRIPALEPMNDHSIRLASEQCGGQNCHLDVAFEDGVVWIARLRLTDPLLPPSATQDFITQSEVATLKFLESTSVPSPRLHCYELDSPHNTVGNSYVLMDKMPGRPLNWQAATADQKLEVMEQLADVFLELEKHPFQLTGSLVPKNTTEGTVQVGPYAQKPWFETPEQPLGPFSALTDAYKAVIELQQQAITNYEISSLPTDNYLSLQWRISRLSTLTSASTSNNGPFYLKHYDDKGDHILVDENYTITGIIDWEFASTEAKELAFSSPCMMWPVGRFFDGGNELAEDEEHFAEIFQRRGREDVHDIIINGRRWQRFLFFLGGGFASDTREFKALFRGLRATFPPSANGDDLEKDMDSYDEWKGKVLDSNPQLRMLLEGRG